MEKIKQTYDQLPEKTKRLVLVVLALLGTSGLIGLMLEGAQQQDQRLDALCGDDRSGCIAEQDFYCDPFGSFTCEAHTSYIQKTLVPENQRQ